MVFDATINMIVYQVRLLKILHMRITLYFNFVERNICFTLKTHPVYIMRAPILLPTRSPDILYYVLLPI
mgnify:CR=1 FL=1